MIGSASEDVGIASSLSDSKKHGQPAESHRRDQSFTRPDFGAGDSDGAGNAEDGIGMPQSGLQDCVNPYEFPAWFFAEVELAGRLRTVAIFHVQTPSGLVPYWFEDPANQHRGLPLLKVMKPVILGDYGSILEGPGAMKIFVLIYKILNDLPDPLTCVQVIRFIARRSASGHGSGSGSVYGNGKINNSGGNRFSSNHSEVLWATVSEALNEVQKAMNDRREEFEMIMSYITGVSPMHHLSKS